MKCSTRHNRVSQKSKHPNRQRRPKGQPKETCSKCNSQVEDARKGQGYCTSCHNAYMRENRKRHSELNEDQRLRANARSYANVYIRRGTLKKMPCEVCGNEKAQMHHEDYSKPLEVNWFCRPCHLEHHSNKQILNPINP